MTYKDYTTENDLIRKDFLLDDFIDSGTGGEKKIANYEIVESSFLSASDIKGVDGVKIEILTETEDVKTDWGMKPQCKVKVTAEGETHEKNMAFNQPTINYLVKKFGKSSKEWIGTSFGITTKFIKGNDAIVPKDSI